MLGDKTWATGLVARNDGLICFVKYVTCDVFEAAGFLNKCAISDFAIKGCILTVVEILFPVAGSNQPTLDGHEILGEANPD